ncbi:cell wall-binding repeat-containing protein [Rossellomorea aquimaris]|uniref:N-acetylmuramoyl-L-alanine amidase n=1 Tax=Rossellomorea aquimaris TaxID=189382 RepID=A0A5D4TKG4_9BACI|nr:cell wall-binding repeat-containing protein [Rossellomorea aquimaris]TYS75815.1 N-acetylmuramoyl-L-alanine amidase [Rossellomorea aquimaris]
MTKQHLLTRKNKLIAMAIVCFCLFLSLGESALADDTSVDRVSGTNRYDTSVKVSQKGWPKGADTVVIAVGDNFPDALAGAPLAYKYNAPILLVPKNKLSGNVYHEIKRLGAKKAFILGGTSVVESSVESQLARMGLEIDRIAGKNRYETASKIAGYIGGTKAVVTYGDNFPDSLSIASYAASNSMPILLTDDNSLPSATKNALKKYRSTIVVGGESAVSKKVYSELPSPRRITGSNRYETATKVVNTLYSASSTKESTIATGESFADALTGSVIAAKKDEPIVLVESDSVPAVVRETINDYQMNSFTIIGGKSVISEQAEKMLTFNPEVLINSAKKHLGTPYKWAGTTPAGFDCSGFVMYVFGQHDISVPRTTTDIWSKGKRVSKPSVGDLVVFTTYKPGPSHVGIYMGDNKFIHSGDRGVEITSMDNVYWNPRYMGAVSFLK